MARRPQPQTEIPAALEAPPEPDRIDGVRPAAETRALLGCDAAEQAFLTAWNAGRLHHAWLLSGPPGVGKASFGYRVLRFLMTRPPDGGAGLFGDGPEAALGPVGGLGVAEDDPVARRVELGGHPGVAVLRRGWNEKTKKFRTAISVEDVRALAELFHLSAADGGWRAALIDPADELNANAANALLKLLEEPPERALFLLVSHAPGRLPPTIRSRCRRLQFRPLTTADAAVAMTAAAPEIDPSAAQALARLTNGAPGEALRLHALGGLDAYGKALALIAGLPSIDRSMLAATMGAYGGRDGAERLRGFARLLRLALERLARAGAGAPFEPVSPDEAALAGRLSTRPGQARIWAEAAEGCADRLDAAIGLNLDPQRTILDTALYLEELARRAL